MNLAVMQAADEGREVSFFFYSLFRSGGLGDTSNQVSIPILRLNLIYLQIDSLKLTAKTSEN